MKYYLYVNGVLWDKFRTLKEIDEFIFKKGFDEALDYIEVKKIKKERNINGTRK